MTLKTKIEEVVLNVELTKIPLAKGNRMVRFGVGQHDGRWFVRIDLWVAGYRINRR